MIKLYGFPISNYFNIVKIALIEKGVDFEFVDTRPSQDDDYLAKSPMGKVPCIETEDGFSEARRASSSSTLKTSIPSRASFRPTRSRKPKFANS
ncbi:MAG: glutathione S-transferase N-terminal domain-containing protein [Gammaproteobacteria bacterium]|nr:glutathione S-transferase N-terminal domain-containing protein [Gammaproteobacteria bacterium]